MWFDKKIQATYNVDILQIEVPPMRTTILAKQLDRVARLQKVQAEFDANVAIATAILGDAKAGNQIVIDALHVSKANIQASLNRLQL